MQPIAPTLSSTASIESLRRRAAEQMGADPGSQSVAGSPPPWEPGADMMTPGALESARVPLEALLGQIRARPRFSDQAPVASPDDDSRAEAVRLYARARLALADGENDTAMTLLETASRLDPASGRVWHALGQAQFAAGLRSTGVGSVERAARLGVDDARIWMVIGLDAIRRRKTEDATRWLTAAYDGLGDGADPAAVAWIETSLGELILNQGHLLAGAELIEHALGLLPAGETTSGFRSEYATLVRRRPPLWIRIGDAHAWLGGWERAAAAYELAGAEIEPEQAQQVQERRIGSLDRLGRTAEASLVLLESIKKGNGLVGDALVGVSRELSGREPGFGEALRQLGAQLESPTPSQRSRLSVAQLAASGLLPIAERLALLPPDVPLVSEHAVELISASKDEDERWRAALALVERRPGDAMVVADALVATPLLSGSDLARRGIEPGVLSAAVGLRMGNPDREGDLSALAALAGGCAPAVATAVATGRWDAVPSLLDVARAQSPEDYWRAQAAALRPIDALATWTGWRGEHTPSASQLLEGAQLAAASGDGARSIDLLVEAQQADPYEERAYGMLVAGLLSTGGDARSPETQAALQELRRRLPGCVTLDSLAILDLLGQGYAGQVIDGTRRLIERLACPTEENYSGLYSLWQAAHERGEAAVLDASESWLRARLVPERPEPAAALALSRLLSIRGRAGEALDMLDALPLGPSASVRRERERLLRALGRAEEADEAALVRLGGERLSVIELFELAQIDLSRGESIEPVLVRLGVVPDDVRLTEAEAGVLLTLASRLQGSIIDAGDEAGRNRAAAEFVAAAGFGIDHGLSMREPIHRLRLRYAAVSVQAPLGELVRISEQYAAGVGRIGDEAFAETFGLLMEAGRTQDALRWAVHVVTLGDELDAGRWLQMLSPLGSLGTIETVEHAIERLEARGQLRAAVEAFSPDEAGAAHVEADQRAELCYILAGAASARDRRAQGVMLYQRALEYQPDHPWACNDYGYMLADEGEDLEQAERLLDVAIGRLPDRTNVLDSMGWLRYKQGRFADGDAGEGALTLLARAGESPEGVSNPTIQDHLGDARWMAGDEDGARSAWQLAERLYLERVRGFTTPEQRRLPQYTAVQARLRDVRSKLTALEIEGQVPAVAPTLGQRREPGT